MIYLTLDEYYKLIFNGIRQFVYDDKTKPNYENESKGVEELKSILEFVKNNRYYPNLTSKAAYLLVTISTGHKFSNGNKRLALFTYVYFLHRNKATIRSRRMDSYRKWFKEHFPDYKMSRNNFNRNVGWALYNFNKCMNIKKEEEATGHSYNYDELKTLTEQFTEFTYKIVS